MGNKFFQDADGNYSSTRLIGFIVIMYSLLLASAILWFGYKEGSTVIVTAASGVAMFTGIAGPAMFFLFSNKKEEIEGSK